MVDDNKIRIKAELDASKDFDTLPESLSNAKKYTKEFQKELKQLQPVIRKAAKEWEKYNRALQQTGGGRSISQTAKMIAGGNPGSQIRNAQASGQINNNKASSANLNARVINAEAQEVKNVNRALKSRETLQSTINRQTIASNDLTKLGTQIEGQKYRVLLKTEQIKKLSGAAQTSATGTLKKEEAALNNLLAKRTQLLNVQRQQTMEQNRANKVDSLLGDSGAALLKIQSGLFLNYALMSKTFQLFQFGTRYVIEFDAALRDLQAIVVASDEAIKGLSDTFIDISKNTRFSAVEIAEAAVVLGQAGLEAAQIKTSMESIVLLATASGSDLKTSVDVTTSALTVFKLEASEASSVADTLTTALNLTKLTMDKLSLGIQYAGNVAAEAGSTLEELVAILGGVSNAGIKSGSTIGTGIARLFTQLQAPTAKFENELRKVGLGLSDVDVRAKGMVGVLETLREAGFGSANAFEAFEIRAARGFLAASRNTETIRNLGRQFALSGSAAQANATQMRSLANSGKSLRNSLGAVIIEGADPLKESLIVLADVASAVLNVMSEMPFVLKTVGTGLTSAFGGLATFHLYNLTKNLFNFKTALTSAAPVIGTVVSGIELQGKAAVVTTGKVNLLSKAMAFLSRSPIVALTAGFFALISVVGLFRAASDELTGSLDRSKASFDEAKGELDATKQSINSLEEEINRLSDRYEYLNENQDELTNTVLKLQGSFKEFGAELRTDTITTVEDLTTVILNLQKRLRELSSTQLGVLQAKNALLLQEQVQNSVDSADRIPLGKFGLRGRQDTVARQSKGFNPETELPDSDLFKNASTLRRSILSQVNEDRFIQVNTLAEKELKNYEKKYEGLNNTIQTTLTDLYAAKGRAPEKSDARRIFQEEIDRAEALQQSIKNLGSTINRSFETTNQINENNVLSSKGFAKAKANLIELSRGISSSKSSSDASGIKNNIKQIEALRKQYIITDESTEEQKQIAKSNIESIAKEAKISFEKASRIINDSFAPDINDEVAGAKLAVERLAGDSGKSANKLANALRDMENLTIQNAQRQVDMATQDIDQAISKLDATIASIEDAERGGLAPNYSDAELDLLQDKRFKLETERIRIRKEALEETVPLLDKTVARQTRLLEISKANVNQKDAASLTAARQALQDYNQALDRQLKVKNEIAELEGQYAARTKEETEAHFSLSEQLQDIIRDYQNQEIAQKSLGQTIRESITDNLNDARTGFGNFISDWVKGTSTAGDAFRNFALGVIENMADMAAQQAASSIFGSVLGGIGSLFGKGVTAYSAPVGPTLPSGGGGFNGLPSKSLSLMQGGHVRRAALGYQAPNRDSVPAMLMPGEFVMRKSAVDMMGSKNLSRINAQGNRRVSNNTASAMAPKDGSDKITNVYVVSEGNQPAMSKNDVIVAISEDLSRNGTTAKLVKRVIQQ